MIKKKIRDAFNKQIQHETFSSYLYLSMAAYFHQEGFDGMARWMRVQAMEEMEHAMKFFDHIHERDGKVELLAIKKPENTWSSPLDAFKAALKHEKFITSKIEALATLAEAESDHASKSMLQWFIDEQVEEEANASRNVQMLEMAGKAGHAILMIDRELGSRTYTMPSPGGEGE